MTQYLMVFPELRSTENYAMKNPAITSDLSQLSLCFFIKLVQDQGLQNVVSYASEHDNDMIFEIYPTLGVFTVGNKKIHFTSTNLYDDTWQHLCLTWENTQGVTKLYKDGQFTGQVTNNATKNYVLKAGGFLVLGQEQDSIGGGFDRKQTFHGRLASVNIWDKVLSEGDIAAQYTNCSIPHGSVINWSVFKNLTHGNVTVEEP
ncbi:C-reactive protein-like [Pocillopora verrucosa]|uniref:C-reactive protein-like n=1 Tax=Pocillopora verrucosa TaxID=203993 RepID=UPI0033412ACB